MEIERRMGLRVRSKYEDVVAWLQSDPLGVLYPQNREALHLWDSHVYNQINGLLNTLET